MALVFFETGGPDVVQFVFLRPVSAGTQLFVTDQGWVQDSSSANETLGQFFMDPGRDGVLRYTVPSGGHPASA